MQHRDGRDASVFRRLGLLLVGVGGLCALATLGKLTFLYDLWPLLVMMLGIGLIGIFIRRRCRGFLFLGSGVYIIGFGGLALYCNFTSWARMALIWPAFIGLLGVCLVVAFVVHRGGRAVLAGGLVLVAVAVAFCLMLALGGQYWWSMLILVGLSILIPGSLPCRRNP